MTTNPVTLEAALSAMTMHRIAAVHPSDPPIPPADSVVDIGEVHARLRRQPLTNMRSPIDETVAERLRAANRAGSRIYISIDGTTLSDCQRTRTSVYHGGGEYGDAGLRHCDSPSDLVYRIDRMSGYPRYRTVEDQIAEPMLPAAGAECICSIDGLGEYLDDLGMSIGDNYDSAPTTTDFIPTPDPELHAIRSYVPLVRKCRLPRQMIAPNWRMPASEEFMHRLRYIITLPSSARGRGAGFGAAVGAEGPEPNRGRLSIALSATETIEIVTSPHAMFDVDSAFIHAAGELIMNRRFIEAPFMSGTVPSMTLREHWREFSDSIVMSALANFGCAGSFELFSELVAHTAIPRWHGSGFYAALQYLMPIVGKRVLLSQAGPGDGILPIALARPAALVVHTGCPNRVPTFRRLIDLATASESGAVTLIVDPTLHAVDAAFLAGHGAPIGGLFDSIILDLPSFAREYYPESGAEDGAESGAESGAGTSEYNLTDYDAWRARVLGPMLTNALKMLAPGGYLLVIPTDTTQPLIDGKPIPCMPECLRLGRKPQRGLSEESCYGHAAVTRRAGAEPLVERSRHTFRYPVAEVEATSATRCVGDAVGEFIRVDHEMACIATIVISEGAHEATGVGASDDGRVASSHCVLWRRYPGTMGAGPAEAPAQTDSAGIGSTPSTPSPLTLPDVALPSPSPLPGAASATPVRRLSKSEPNSPIQPALRRPARR